VITVGVDLAAEPKRTAMVRISWTDERAQVTHAVGDVDDDQIVALSPDADKIGIDCPLGWPDAFVDFVVAHRDGGVTTPAATIGQRRPLAYRATDLYCRDVHQLRPLSVSADRIAHAALRCAALLPRLGVDDRSGAGRVVEAYPAGSLQVWGLQHRRYKDDPAQIRRALASITDRVGLEFATATRAACEASDHAFDALVVALTARAAAQHPPEIPIEFADQARREGWISLPDPALEALRGSPAIRRP
jgi:predicted nuclease with RNAse H fold